MKTPRFLLGVTLLFWGWHTGWVWLGLAAAVAVEAAHVIQARWEFSQADFDRVWNLCVALFLGGTIYAFFSNDNFTVVTDLINENSPASRLATLNQSKRSLFQLLQWLPLMFLPILLAQLYSEKQELALSTFSWWLRRKRTEPRFHQHYSTSLNVSHPFFACCLFGASATNQRTAWFTIGLVALIAWALWRQRSRSFSNAGWALSLFVALGLGFGVQLALIEAHKLLQRLDEVLLARWSGGRQFDAKENQTRIGAIGRLKLSGRILLRVTADGERPPPPLLREASYNLFRAPVWSAAKRDFERIAPENDLSTWILQTETEPAEAVGIAGYMPGGKGLLALPNGAARLDQLPAIVLATNSFGSVRVDEGPGFFQFSAAYDGAGAMDSPPDQAADVELPSSEQAAVHQIATALKLQELAPEDAIRAVEQFFAQNFTYSTWQRREHQATAHRTALTRFLLEHRSGHCEYFATATVLLLRAANIPSRYAAGYAVQEKGRRHYIVRERHAHAWAMAWIDNAWRDIDTTPASWTSAEGKRASLWEPLRDLGSRIWFEFSRWRWGHAEWKGYLLWLVVPLLAFALGKVLFQRQWNRTRRPDGAAQLPSLWPGLDSEFYAVEQKLAAAGLGRQPGETGLAWLQRLEEAGAIQVNGLQDLLGWHYRLRFDPLGLGPAERKQLRQQASSLSRRLSQTLASLRI